MPNKKDIKIVGAGPAGLVAAIDLNRAGYNVIVYDKQDSVGGEPAWHPSVHSTPVSKRLFDYIGIDCREAFAESTQCFKAFVFGEQVDVNPYQETGLFNTERGHRPTSLDNVLYRTAVREGVNFEFRSPWKEDDFRKAPKGTIIATGLSAGVYEWLEIPCSVFAGYWAYSEIEKDYISTAGYFGSYGWSGGALRELKEIVEPLKWEWQDALEFNGAPTPETLRQGEALGERFARGLLES